MKEIERLTFYHIEDQMYKCCAHQSMFEDFKSLLQKLGRLEDALENADITFEELILSLKSRGEK